MPRLELTSAAVTCALACVLTFGWAATLPAASPRRPNIVLIIADDQAFGDFGFMGNDEVHTPCLDQLARQAAVYPNGYVPSSVCRPSLATLLTGLYPHQHLIHFNHPPPGFAGLTTASDISKAEYDRLRRRGSDLILRSARLPHELAKHGYRCLQTGKFWEGHYRNAGFTEGMTVGEPSGGPLGDKQLPSGEWVAHGNGDHGLKIGRETMQPIFDFIDDCQDTPFMIWYAPFLPHTPHDSPPRLTSQYANQSIPPYRIPYYASISQFDETVGELTAGIESRGLAEETLFLLVSDNGWRPDPQRPVAGKEEWNHTARSKRAPFEDGVRTPIAIRWDGHVQPARFDQLVSTVDVMPTLLKAAQIDLSTYRLPGVELLSSATGVQPLPNRRPIFGEIYPGDASVLENPAADIAYRFIRQGRWKLIVPHPRSDRAAWGNYVPSTALFDVVADPQESTNLIDQAAQQPRVAELRKQLDKWWNPLNQSNDR